MNSFKTFLEKIYQQQIQDLFFAAQFTANIRSLLWFGRKLIEIKIRRNVTYWRMTVHLLSEADDNKSFSWSSDYNLDPWIIDKIKYYSFIETINRINKILLFYFWRLLKVWLGWVLNFFLFALLVQNTIIIFKLR